MDLDSLVERQLLPPLTDEQFRALKADIAARGVLVPIVVTRGGVVIDGHHRLRAVRELVSEGRPVPSPPLAVVDGRLDEAEERAMARALNLARRQLTSAEKRALIAEQLKETPDRSDRWVARNLGVDHKTVGAVRRRLVAEGVLAGGVGETEGDERFVSVRFRTGTRAGVRHGAIADRYLEPPFTALNARSGRWRAREGLWKAWLGYPPLPRPRQRAIADPPFQLYNLKKSIRDDLTTGEVAERWTAPPWQADHRSLFDPYLCELIYRWFCPPRGAVLDPFAGAATRGAVAAALGLRYVGVDLSAEQVEANERWWGRLVGGSPGGSPRPLPTGLGLGDRPTGEARWVQGDARELDRLVEGRFDLVFTCPPYHDLERYTDDPRDLSNCPTYEDFLSSLAAAFRAALSRLRDDRFVVVVVGDARRQGGDGRRYELHPIVADTVKTLQSLGVLPWNHAVVATEAGYAALKMGVTFEASRKMPVTHSHVLVGWKGDPARVPGYDEDFPGVGP